MNWQPGKLYSYLDLLGARYVCDGCKAESPSTLTAEEAKREALALGWSIGADGARDLCPACAARIRSAASALSTPDSSVREK